MRLSTILELLLIFLLIAFAAYGKVIGPNAHLIEQKTGLTNNFTSVAASATASLKQAAEDVNKYCTCNENICNCCRNFHIPLVKLSGPGCASLQYLQDDKLAMQLSMGDNILSTSIINGKNPSPVCVALPGGYSKFCGKIYSIKREADKHFKACLGLELRSAAELEASLRVSCFRFGPDGLKLRPAEPLPPAFIEPAPAEDDYDDLFGLADDDDEDEEEDNDYEKVSPDNNAVSSSTLTEEQDQDQEQEEDDDDDLLGFGALLDIFSDDDDSASKKKTKVTSTPLPLSFTIPILSLQSTPAHPLNQPTVSKNPLANAATAEPIISSASTPSTRPAIVSTPIFDNKRNFSVIDTSDDLNTDSTHYLLEESTKPIVDKNIHESTTTSVVDEDIIETNNIPVKNNTNKKDKIKHKKIQIVNKKKNNVTAPSVNVVNNDPIKVQETHQNDNTNDDADNEYDYDISQDDEEIDDLDDSSEKLTSGEQDEKDEGEENDKNTDSSEVSLADGGDYDEDDDSDEEIEDDEEAVIDALVDDEQHKSNNHTNKHKKKNKIVDGKPTDTPQDDTDYGYGLTELLSRKHSPVRTINNQKVTRIGRQSKVMRF